MSGGFWVVVGVYAVGYLVTAVLAARYAARTDGASDVRFRDALAGCSLGFVWPGVLLAFVIRQLARWLP